MEQYLGIEYNRYLQEVVQILESDPEFRKKLESSDPEDIRVCLFPVFVFSFRK